MNKIIHFFQQIFSPISNLDIALFFRQLVTLTSAGVPIVQSMGILSQAQENLIFRNLLQNIKRELEAGRTLANALKKFPRYFDELTCHLIYAGEQAGALDTTLARAAFFKEKSNHLKNQIIQALFYPSLTFLTAITVTAIMLNCVVPHFEELFQTMHGKLPAFTAFVIHLSHLLHQYAAFTLIFPALLLLFFYFLKSNSNFKQHFDQFLLQIPVIKSILTKILLARFMRLLATTLNSGVPILTALKLTAKSSGNSYFMKSVFKLQIKISTGQQLHSAMRQDKLFPILTIQLIKVGEESGSLEKMLDKIADIYESQIDMLIAYLSRLLEPLIMVILGVLIGGLVIAMYLPIFKLGTVV